MPSTNYKFYLNEFTNNELLSETNSGGKNLENVNYSTYILLFVFF